MIIYLVVSKPDLHYGLAREAPRLITEDAKKALTQARQACADENVNQVFIYRLCKEQVYELADFISKGANKIVFVASWNFAVGGWTERFYDGFDRLFDEAVSKQG